MTPKQQAFLLAAVLLDSARASEIAATAGLGARAQDELDQLLRLPRDERAEWLAREVRRLVAEPALDHVHPSWFEAADAPELARARGEGQAWLCRRVSAAFVAMDPDEPLLTLPLEHVTAAIARLGLKWLAAGLCAAPAPAAAAVAARLGEAWGAQLIAEMRTSAARANAREAVRDLAELAAGTSDHLLFRAGARYIAAALEGDMPRALAQRLPRPLGLVLLDECAGRVASAPARLGELRQLAQDQGGLADA